MRHRLEALVRWGLGLLTTGFLGRVMRYGAVGVTVATLHSLAILALVPLIHPLRPTVASVIAFCMVLPVGYGLHRRYSFADRAGGWDQAWRFTITNITSFVVSVGGMYVITEILHISYLFGIAWNWVAVPAINFGVYMFWVFRHPAPRASEE